MSDDPRFGTSRVVRGQGPEPRWPTRDESTEVSAPDSIGPKARDHLKTSRDLYPILGREGVPLKELSTVGSFPDLPTNHLPGRVSEVVCEELKSVMSGVTEYSEVTSQTEGLFIGRGPDPSSE